MTQSEHIYYELKAQGLIDATGIVTMSLLDVEFKLTDKSAFGSIVQEWLSHWFEANNINFRINENSQIPPDFYLPFQGDEEFLEVKAFDFSASANFDVANFDTYTRSLLIDPQKLFSKYLIFAYCIEGDVLKIKDIWLKNVWEICTFSDRFPIKTQCKQGKIVNIRPALWYSKNPKTNKPFKDVREFLNALQETISVYEHLSNEINRDTWLEDVLLKYRKQTGLDLF